MSNQKPKTIDEYISKQPEQVQVILQGIRETIHRAVPEATETMSYDMPTFDLNGHHLIYFSAWKDHIGLYPLYTEGGALKELLAPYHKAQNSIHLPYSDSFPYEVVEQFAKFRVVEEADKPHRH
ncbi:MAG TPA: DUF1801 domain-containing protein [Candidatus Saccharimonadales bacterium]|nr:DUF1801 domain-containing protein [Candidatus Saccharimonadales bacterium]